MMKFFNKRGISPLIATVLIIGFTVALSAVVMTWGTGFVRDTTTATAESTNLALACAKLNYQIGTVTCNAGKTAITAVEVVNNGDHKIVSTIHRVTRPAPEGTTTFTTPGTVGTPDVGPFEVKSLSVTDTGTAAPARLGVIAKIVNPANNEEVTCADTIIEKANPCA